VGSISSSRYDDASDRKPRLGPTTYAIIANCELVTVTVVVVGAAVLGEQADPARVGYDKAV
jgi:hypothetical protein